MSKLFPMALAVVLLSGCPPAIRRPESPQLVVTGTLVAGGWNRRGEALNAAKVTVRAIGGEELVTNTTSSAGGYRLAVTVSTPTRVVFIAEAPGYAPYVKAFTAGPYAELTLNAALTPLTPWECLDASCTAPLIDLDWASPPVGASGSAATFDVEVPLLVDADVTRPALLALGWAELSGGTDGFLALHVPFASWSKLVDATPGTGVLELEAASFDVASAKWTKLGPVPLLSEGGFPLPESALASLQRGESAAGVVARLPVTSGKFLAVLGAPTPTGCASGTLNAEGKPATGASVGYKGFEATLVGADGSFCALAPVGGDVTPQKGSYAGLPYALGPLARPSSEGTCGGSCASLGKLELIADALQTAKLCSFTGKVIDSMGQAVANATVIAFDASVTGATMDTFCGKNGARCALTSPSAADGTFSIRGPLLGSMFVGATATTSSTAGDSQRSTGQFIETCPTSALTLKLDRGLSRLETTATFSGNQLSWDPPRAAMHVTVTDSTGVVKWELTSPVGFTPPLTWGSPPVGATELTAPVLSPATGDLLEVELDGVGRDGVAYVGAATATRP
ncbi:MAG: hypothetical protein U0228_15075 [Myxococcaceae bacterium]